MLLSIESTAIWRRLQDAAQAQKSTPANVAARLLDEHLPGAQNSGSLESPLKTERKRKFQAWLESNRELALPKLPDEAMEREAIYADERHSVQESK